jgi:uncharacterized protein YggT (Ycf19 family)
MTGSSFLTYWSLYTFHRLLGAALVLLFARLLLLWALGSGNAPMRLLIAVTSPVTAAVGAITPRIVPSGAVIVFAIVWLLAARLALSVAALMVGVRL